MNVHGEDGHGVDDGDASGGVDGVDIGAVVDDIDGRASGSLAEVQAVGVEVREGVVDESQSLARRENKERKRERDKEIKREREEGTNSKQQVEKLVKLEEEPRVVKSCKEL